ncbi:MAG: threonine/serine exporter family protein [Clostridiales bacterium]|nr:threonine/serine exporter family protein [Clostridiales bacterium]
MKFVQIIAAFIGVCCYGFSTETPRKFIIYAGIGGGLAWLFYLLTLDLFDSVVFANFIGAFSVGIYSHILARKLCTPVTVFLLGGILPLVPGSQIYRAVYFLIAQQNKLSAQNLILTLKIAGVIALAIFLVDTIFIMMKKEQNLDIQKEEL